MQKETCLTILSVGLSLLIGSYIGYQAAVDDFYKPRTEAISIIQYNLGYVQGRKHMALESVQCHGNTNPKAIRIYNKILNDAHQTIHYPCHE